MYLNLLYGSCPNCGGKDDFNIIYKEKYSEDSYDRVMNYDKNHSIKKFSCRGCSKSFKNIDELLFAPGKTLFLVSIIKTDKEVRVLSPYYIYIPYFLLIHRALLMVLLIKFPGLKLVCGNFIEGVIDGEEIRLYFYSDQLRIIRTSDLLSSLTTDRIIINVFYDFLKSFLEVMGFPEFHGKGFFNLPYQDPNSKVIGIIKNIIIQKEGSQFVSKVLPKLTVIGIYPDTKICS